jgi:hypothetical protein
MHFSEDIFYSKVSWWHSRQSGMMHGRRSVVAEDSQDGRAGLLNLHVCFAVQKVLGFISFSQNLYMAIFGCPIFLMNWKYNTVGCFIFAGMKMYHHITESINVASSDYLFLSGLYIFEIVRCKFVRVFCSTNLVSEILNLTFLLYILHVLPYLDPSTNDVIRFIITLFLLAMLHVKNTILAYG